MKLKLCCHVVLIAGLSACAHQGAPESQPAPVATSAGVTSGYVGFAVESLQPNAVADYMKEAFSALNKTLAESETTRWQMVQSADGSIRLQATAATGFEAGSAELRPVVLDVLARIAAVARTFNKTTVHVAVNGYDATAAGFSQSLADRRAAALATYLEGQGIGDARVRAEGSAKTQADVLQIVIKPVVSGAESQAWMSPS